MKSSKPKETPDSNKPPRKASPGDGQAAGAAANRLIDLRISELGGWPGETVPSMRKQILNAETEIIEEVKWRDTPVSSRNRIICTGESYTQPVKLTLANAASIPHPP